MDQAEVVSARAEASAGLLFRTLAIHRRRSTRSSVKRSRLRLESDQFDSDQPHRQLTLLRLVSIVEEFCADQLHELGEADMQPHASRSRQIIWDRTSADVTGSWHKIRGAFKDWYSITPSWEGVEDLIEARNAIAHGLGRLTRRQRRVEQSTLAKLQRAKISVEGDRIVLAEVDLATAAQTCRTLIYELDGEIQRKRGAHLP